VAYAQPVHLRDYVDLSSQSDDNLLEDLIARAQKIIEEHCGVSFEVTADTTRTFDVIRDVHKRVVHFDQWLAQITTVTNDADAASPETVAATQYITLPRNEGPYYGIELKQSSTIVWTYDADPADGIEITGRWGWSVTVPDDIRHWTIRLAVFLYRQRESSADLDRPLLTADGVTILPSQIPNDVLQGLRGYRQLTLMGA